MKKLSILNLSQARKKFRIALALTTVLSAGIALPASAQTMNDTPLPTRYVIDKNGVNLTNGYHYGSDTIIASIGSGSSQLSIHAHDGANEYGLQAYNGAIQVSGSTYTVTIPGTNKAQETFGFTQSGSSYISNDGKGASLVYGIPAMYLRLTMAASTHMDLRSRHQGSLGSRLV